MVDESDAFLRSLAIHSGHAVAEKLAGGLSPFPEFFVRLQSLYDEGHAARIFITGRIGYYI
jgi:hypothetical protein